MLVMGRLRLFLESKRGENPESSLLPRPHTIGDTDTCECIASQGEPGEPLPQCFDSLQPFEMTNAILRHRALPFVNAREEGFCV